VLYAESYYAIYRGSENAPAVLRVLNIMQVSLELKFLEETLITSAMFGNTLRLTINPNHKMFANFPLIAPPTLYSVTKMAQGPSVRIPLPLLPLLLLFTLFPNRSHSK
jgi:hypothetical protein